MVYPAPNTKVITVQGYTTDGINSPICFQDSSNMVHLINQDYAYGLSQMTNVFKQPCSKKRYPAIIVRQVPQMP
jgi:hypothetical protein